jgi:D-lactate dehydrogenase (cytochrome)
MHSPALLDEFRRVSGEAQVLTDEANLLLYSRDVAFWDDAPLVDIVVRPGCVEEVAALVRIAAANDLAIAPRGGGVSYTGGYVPERAGTVLFDLTRMNRIHEINSDDLYATVGPGVTWQQLNEAAQVEGLRSVMKGPISGSVATIAGTASQNTGSAPMSSFLGLEVVLADGRIVHTGATALVHRPSGFYRSVGPDLTGLFLGDTGAFGIKTRVALAVERLPGGSAFASVGFDSLAQMTAVMTRLARSGIPCRVIGMDPVKNRTAAKVDAREGLSVLKGVLKSSGSLTDRLRSVANVAGAGRSLKSVAWSMHITVDAYDSHAADSAMASLRPLWTRQGTEIPPSVGVALRARPYSIRGIVGVKGERWVPVHGVFPLSRAEEAARCTQEFFAAHAAQLAAHGIEHSYIVVCNGPVWLLEPMFYWADELSPLHAQVLGEKYLKFKDIPANPAARAVVGELRQKLNGLFCELGAVHSQLGKFYDFAGSVEPHTYDVLTAFKQVLDPQRRFNPGNLGWH